MKKLLCVIICISSAAVLLSGCTNDGAGADGTASDTSISATDTAETFQTDEASETALQTEEEMSETEEDVAYEADEEMDDDADEDVAEPVEEPVDYPRLMQEKGLPENAKLYDMNDGAIPDMPEFSLSTENLSDYERMNTERVRLRIKSILDCAVSGEVPAYKQNGYVWQSPQQLAGVKLNSWEIADEKIITDGNFRYEVTVTMDVAKSGSEFVTVGRDDYLMIYYPGEDRSFMPLRKVDGLDESRLLPVYGDSKPYIDFCTYYTAYFRDFFSGGTVEDLSAPNVTYDTGNAVFCAYVASRVAGGFPNTDDGIVPYDEFNRTLEKILGFSADAIDAKSCMYYNADEDRIEIPGRGTSWLCGWLTEDTEGNEEGTRVVTIDYYEDDFYLVKSRTVRYTLRNNDDDTYSMLKIERLFTSDRNILGGSV